MSENNGEMLEVVELDDLLAPGEQEKKFDTKSVPVSAITVPADRAGDPVDQAFVDSIARYGMLQPIRVALTNGEYTLLDGWRRFQAAKALGQKSINAVIEHRDLDDLQQLAIGLVTNYQRSENFVGAALRVWAILDAGVEEKVLAKQTGMKLEKIRGLRDMRKLRPELWDACEAGQMNEWSARMAARLDDEKQQYLVDVLEETGKVTKSNVEDARRVGRQEAAAELPATMFQAPGLGGDEDETEPWADAPEGMYEEYAAGRAESTESDETGENDPQPTKAKYTRTERYGLVKRQLQNAKAEMLKIKAPRTAEEAEVLDRINDLIDSLAEMGDEG